MAWPKVWERRQEPVLSAGAAASRDLGYHGKDCDGFQAAPAARGGSSALFRTRRGATPWPKP
jgi:hypothetical protein